MVSDARSIAESQDGGQVRSELTVVPPLDPVDPVDPAPPAGL